MIAPATIIASTTTANGKTVAVFDRNGIIEVTIGQNNAKGWAHKRTTTYATIAKAMAAYAKATA